MAADGIGLAGTLGGGALLGVVLAALGLRKLIAVEVSASLKPIKSDVDKMAGELKMKMTEQSHKLICGMHAKNVAQKITSLENTTNLQIDGIKEHIDARFDELTRRLDRRRSADGGSCQE